MTPEIEKKLKAIQAGKVPAGYRKTAVGIVPKEWKDIFLGEIFTDRNECNCLSMNLLSITADKGIVPRSEIKGKDNSSEDKSKYKRVYTGDIAYNTMRMWQGVSAISAFDGIVSPAYTVLNPSKNICAPFFSYLFRTKNLINLFYRNSQGLVDDTRSLKYEWFKKILVSIPPLPKQRKIAEILTAQDRVIALKEKLVAEKRKQKKFLMNQLLSCENEKKITINDIKIDKTKWIFKTIGDVCSTFSGGTPNRSHSEYFNGSIPWIKSGELNKENIYQTEEFLTQKGIENSSTKIVKKGTLLIAMYGATAGILAFTHIDAAINQAILALVPKIEINLFYLKYALENKIDIAVHKYVQGGQPNFNATIIESFKIEFPTLPEQQAIAEVLSAADREISLLQQNLEQERQKKKSLMQLLLSGLVRVNAPEDFHEL